ncbi:MAG: thioredoxin domain-containing protein, partial [Pseudomonadota bacterium]|nr:thioredoxin domain-containing protein [Pseudomonadota bacterium]
MTRKQLLSVLVAVAAIVVLAVAYFVYTGGSDGDVLQQGSKLTIELSPRDKALGSPKAPIQFVEYAAPSCPHCAHWDEDVFPILKKEYIDTGKVYYVFRVFPLSSLDVAVESMARCLPADSYFQFIDMMYRNQDKWDPDGA